VKELSEFFKALSCEWRIRIIEMIGEGYVCQCEFAEKLPIDSTTLSRHLKVLKDSGILIERKEGRKKFYSLKNEEILTIIELTRKLLKG